MQSYMFVNKVYSNAMQTHVTCLKNFDFYLTIFLLKILVKKKFLKYMLLLSYDLCLCLFFVCLSETKLPRTKTNDLGKTNGVQYEADNNSCVDIKLA